ncbi:hypothetical protein Nepgr_025146 [Nepenthes gracilis]|uniref:Uncharacterized protein n=1 Tax=Nepenthes gracilis TaxID=150966 RepID=A0AAD3T5L7_NEPGR|nr:hypothetical protein Nepgr_025146 [Nepenthes gracilis]
MGHSVLPKSTNETRIKGNLDVVDCLTFMFCKQQLQELTKYVSNKLGNAWACGKELKHYPAIGGNGTTIAIQSFVFVMDKEGRNERTRNFGEQQCFLKVHCGAEHWKKVAYKPLCQDIKYYMSSRRLFTFKNVEFNKCWDGRVLKGDEKIELLSQDSDIRDSSYEVGVPVDAWWSDEWWKGIIAGVSNRVIDRMHVYILGENLFLNVLRQNL